MKHLIRFINLTGFEDLSGLRSANAGEIWHCSRVCRLKMAHILRGNRSVPSQQLA
jgi:hypothetical protein